MSHASGIAGSLLIPGYCHLEEDYGSVVWDASPSKSSSIFVADARLDL